MYISTHYLRMPTMAQEIIIGMVNGEQWSYTSCARITCLYVCIVYIHLYTYTLYKSFTGFAVGMGVVLLPLYVYIAQPSRVSAFSYQEYVLHHYVYTLMDNANCSNRNAEGNHKMSIWLHCVVCGRHLSAPCMHLGVQRGKLWML